MKDIREHSLKNPNQDLRLAVAFHLLWNELRTLKGAIKTGISAYGPSLSQSDPTPANLSGKPTGRPREQARPCLALLSSSHR